MIHNTPSWIDYKTKTYNVWIFFHPYEFSSNTNYKINNVFFAIDFTKIALNSLDEYKIPKILKNMVTFTIQHK
jgi:hypothetical protein